MGRTEPTKKNPDKVGKVPYQANGKYRAKKNNPKHYVTFEQAKKAYEKGGFDGIGVVINRNDNLVCIDLDDIEDINNLDGDKKNWVQESYTEYSPSENGLHLWIRGQKPEWIGTKQNGIEMFGSEADSFVTVMGNIYTNKPVMANQTLIMSIAEKYFSNQKPQEEEKKAKQKKKVFKFKQVPDNVVINKMFDSKKGEEIKKLFEGDWTGYESQSEADQGLCNHLAYWTNNDSEQMDRLFRSSGLYRDKWDEKRPPNTTYGFITIDKAIEGNETTWDEPEEKEAPEASHVESEDWIYQLETTEKGKNLSNAYNVRLIFENDENLKGKFALNNFSNEVEILGNVPWERSSLFKSINNYDDACLRNYFSIEYGIKGKELINDGLMEIVNKNKFHPVKEYLNNQRGKWDGSRELKSCSVIFSMLKIPN